MLSFAAKPRRIGRIGRIPALVDGPLGRFRLSSLDGNSRIWRGPRPFTPIPWKKTARSKKPERR
jgi:hypothetical protein